MKVWIKSLRKDGYGWEDICRQLRITCPIDREKVREYYFELDRQKAA
jgi:hypothetical protein